jgi:hypothetical protein
MKQLSHRRVEAAMRRAPPRRALDAYRDEVFGFVVAVLDDPVASRLVYQRSPDGLARSW